MPDDDVEEVVALGGGRELRIVRPRDAEALLDEEAFEREELLPYWAELWPSGVALARAIADRALRGARTVELGCGLGLPSIAAALAGGRVLATDWAQDGLAYAERNAQANGARLETVRCDWAAPAAIVARAPWDLVLAADVAYERRNVPLLLDLLPRLVDARGEVWLADPGRPPLDDLLAGLGAEWTREERRDARFAAVAVHRLRRR